VDGDPIVAQNATAGHNSNTTYVCATTSHDKHNAPLSSLTVKTNNPQAKESSQSQNSITGMDLLKNLSNPQPQQAQTARAK
jgi:hypothetical protein